MRFASMVVFTSLLAACPRQRSAQEIEPTLSQAAATPSPAAPSPSSASPYECNDDSDCELVELGACDICNGGWALSARRGHGESLRRRFGEPHTMACTERGCQSTPVCIEHRCAMSVGDRVRRNFEVVGQQRCEKRLDCAAVEVGGQRRALGTGLLMEYLAECRGSNGAKCELGPSAFDGARCDRPDGGAGTCEVNP